MRWQSADGRTTVAAIVPAACAAHTHGADDGCDRPARASAAASEEACRGTGRRRRRSVLSNEGGAFVPAP